MSAEYPAAKVQALRDVTLSVRRGHIVGLVGPNGAGKSTLIKLIAGLMRPTKGTIMVLGGSPTDPRIRRGVGFSFEAPQFPSHLTPSEVGLYVADLRRLGRESRQAVARALEAVGLGREKRLTRDLSQGNRQKLGIAIATIGDPEFLVLDEPTANLDPLGKADVIAALRARRSEGGGTLITSHVLPDMERLCDDVVIVNDGTVLLEESMHRVVASGRTLDQVFQEVILGHAAERIKDSS